VDLKTNNDYFPIQNQLTGFIAENECVYCAVRTEYLDIIQVNFRFLTVNLTVMFMATVNYHPLMGLDVNGRPNPGKRPKWLEIFTPAGVSIGY